MINSSMFIRESKWAPRLQTDLVRVIAQSPTLIEIEGIPSKYFLDPKTITSVLSSFNFKMFSNILNEYIFQSRLITSGKDALNVQKFGSFYKQNNFLKFIDICDKTTCNIMAKQALKTKFKCCLNYMQFFMLKTAISALLIKKLKSSSTENIDRSPDSIFIKLGHKLVNI